MSGPEYRIVLQAGVQVCEALGLDPNKVSSLSLNFKPGELPEVLVWCNLDDAAANGLLVELKKYRLDPIPDEFPP